MTYIELINAVWELREQGIITMCEHDLYNYLLHKCNRLNWKNPFSQSTVIICAVLGINRNTLLQRRKRLKQLGLITYKEGKAKTRPAEYRIMAPDRKICCSPVNKEDRNKYETKRKKAEKREGFTKPLLKDIADYCKERSNVVDAQAFYDFYQSKDWMIGYNRMKDWKAAVRTWEKNQRTDKHKFASHDNEKQYEKF